MATTEEVLSETVESGDAEAKTFTILPIGRGETDVDIYEIALNIRGIDGESGSV